MPPSDQTLPQKEAATFKLILKCYETKQHKKALKAADSILRKFPEHGETLAMKGLTLNSLEKKKEAYEFVRQGLKFNMKSHVCWHVYGLLFRSDREYKQAINCYVQALKRDEDNGQILRDLSLLQVQTRDLKGFRESRRTLLSANAKNRNNWISFAVANHLCGDLDNSTKVLEAYEGTLEKTQKLEYEHSEMLMYKMEVLREAGLIADALAHLEKSEPMVLDKLSLRENKASLLLELNQVEKSQEVYESLVATNSENWMYHRGLLKCMGYALPEPGSTTATPAASDTVEAALAAKYDALLAKHPRSSAVKRIPLEFKTGDRFVSHLDEYIRPWIRKGIPSLFNDLKSLYLSADKATAIQALFEKHLASLTANQTFATPTYTPTAEDGSTENPCSVLWILYFLAQHYDWLGETDKALECLDRASVHTPTIIDLYLVQGRVYKHAGALTRASDCCEEGRRMDLADRYLNTVSVRFALRADRLKLAESVVSLFTKDGDNANNLFDMQCMWFEIKYGHSCLRQGLWGKALKKLMAVDKHFTDILDDQFDFHSYCVRKMTIRAYVSLLRAEDEIYGHRLYIKAAAGIIQAYINLHDKPRLTKEQEEAAELAGLSESEKKKVLSKRKRAAARAATEAATKEAEDKSSEKKAGSKTGHKKNTVDADPDGEELAKVENPLDCSLKFVERLQRFAPKRSQTHHLACEVWTRKGKVLRVLQSVKKAVALDPTHPDTHRCLVKFLHLVETSRATLAPAVQAVVDAEVAEFLPLAKGGAAAVSAQFLDACASISLAHRLAGAEMQVHLSAAQRPAAVALLTQGPAPSLKQRADAIRAHTWLSSVDPDGASQFGQRCRAIFKHCEYFSPELKKPEPTDVIPKDKDGAVAAV